MSQQDLLIFLLKIKQKIKSEMKMVGSILYSCVLFNFIFFLKNKNVECYTIFTNHTFFKTNFFFFFLWLGIGVFEFYILILEVSVVINQTMCATTKIN